MYIRMYEHGQGVLTKCHANTISYYIQFQVYFNSNIELNFGNGRTTAPSQQLLVNCWLTVNLQLNDQQLPKINVGAGELLFAMP